MRRKLGFIVCVLLPMIVIAGLGYLIATHVSQRTAAVGRNVYTAPPKSSSTHTKLSVKRAYLGLYEPDAPKSFADNEQFATKIGVRPAISLYYSSWWEPFQSHFADTARAHGSVPFVQMIPAGQGVSIKQLIAGQYDNYIRTFASEIAHYNHPVIVSFAPEANGSWYKWGNGKLPASQWIAAWRHVVSTFRSQGANNVTWLWTINRWSNNGRIGTPSKWWPGANYVDWVGIDGYYFQRNETFHVVFGRTLSMIRKFTGKPAIISETSVGPIAGQAAKIPVLLHSIRNTGLIGLVWFDKAQHDGLYHQDWRIEDSAQATNAFKRNAWMFTTIGKKKA